MPARTTHQQHVLKDQPGFSAQLFRIDEVASLVELLNSLALWIESRVRFQIQQPTHHSYLVVVGHCLLKNRPPLGGLQS